MISIVSRDHSRKHYLSLRKAIRSYLCCLFISGGIIGGVLADSVYPLCGHVTSGYSGQGDCTEEPQRYGILVLRIDDFRWFDITIDLPLHPKTAEEVEEQRNRNVQLRKSGRLGFSTFFPNTWEITEGIRLRFHYLFK